ncbi:MAG: sugar transferase [Roseburia sp.]
MYKKEKKSFMKHIDFTIVDILAVQFALVLAFWMRFGFDNPYANEDYMRLAIVMILIDICVVFLSESYTGILRRGNIQEFKAVIVHSTSVFLGTVVYMYGMKLSVIYSRKLLFSFWILAAVIELIGHVLLKNYLRKRMLRARNLSSMVIVTTEEEAIGCLREFEGLPYRDYEITGLVIVDHDRVGEKLRGVPVVACADTFLEYVKKNVVDEVFILGNTRSSSEALADELLELGVTVHFSLVHESSLRPNKVVEKYGHYMVLTTSMRIASRRELFVKRAIDIIGSIVGLVIMGIAFLIFAPIIKIQSPGPVFFSQVRIGRNGRQFKFYKFRTMFVNAEEMKKDLEAQNEMQGLMFKMEDDPRIIPIGKFMRKYSIDELPQFWNVLKGEMSLVGTRPPTVDEFEQYEAHHKARLGIKPGLTGMWQVSGRNKVTDFEEVVALDTSYITNWSIGLDIKILLKTIQVVVSGRGAS